jgi:transmembrane sensor
MKAHHQTDLQRIAERASEWLERLAEDSSPEVHAAFATWVAESPLHVREFLNIAAIDRLLGEVESTGHTLIESVRAGATPVDNVIALEHAAGGRRDVDTKATRTNELAGVHLPIPGQGTGGIDGAEEVASAAGSSTDVRLRPRFRGIGYWAAGIAALAVGIVALWWWQQMRGWHEYTTAIGEQSTVELADGTVLGLNTSSRVQVQFSPQGRDVRLLTGEALFKVHHDPEHPFRVWAGKNVIQALGTEFNVLRRPTGDTTVSVIEGKVQISTDDSARAVEEPSGERAPPRLGAGEEARIAADGRIQMRKGIDADAVTAWRERRLVFRGATLEDIANEFNRYNEHPRIRVQGDALRAQRYTVVLPADDSASLVEYLEQNGNVRIVRAKDEIVISAQ